MLVEKLGWNSGYAMELNYQRRRPLSNLSVAFSPLHHSTPWLQPKHSSRGDSWRFTVMFTNQILLFKQARTQTYNQVKTGKIRNELLRPETKQGTTAWNPKQQTVRGGALSSDQEQPQEGVTATKKNKNKKIIKIPFLPEWRRLDCQSLMLLCVLLR